MNKDVYESPLNSRYASKEMKYIFSPDKKFKTWRKLWVALAEAEMELGLNITQQQIDELKANVDNINYDVAEKREKNFVMRLQENTDFILSFEENKACITLFCTEGCYCHFYENYKDYFYLPE